MDAVVERAFQHIHRALKGGLQDAPRLLFHRLFVFRRANPQPILD